MKIKILKDIPGLDASASREISTEGDRITISNHAYNVQSLLRDGWAEEVKDEVDIEEIRGKYFSIDVYAPSIGSPEKGSNRTFYKSYLIVKTVIDELNDGWEPDFKKGDFNYQIDYQHPVQNFGVVGYLFNRANILPVCKSKEVAKKVIELCGPELKILFNVKD